MDDLAAALEVTNLSRGDDRLAYLEGLFEPLTVGVEVGQRDEAGVIAQADAGREFHAGVIDLVDRAVDGGDLADLDFFDGGAVPAIDPADGQVKDQVEPCLAADQSCENGTQFRADAGEARQVIVEGEEDGVAHLHGC